MHEYSITCSIIEILERIVDEKKIDKIDRVDFEVNEFASIEPDSINFYYEFLTRDRPVLKEAKLSFLKIDPEMKCNDCSASFKVSSFHIRCPECNSTNIRFKEIEDIKITAIHTRDS